jgi:hypothetical protein
MVLGQAPCSADRNKRRNVSCLGLLPAAEEGLCDITALYVARYGASRPGEKVFIVARQQKDGREGYDQETSEIVPESPASHPALAAAASTLPVYMYKGCTRDAQGIAAPPAPEGRYSNKQDSPVEMPPQTAATPALAGYAVPGALQPPGNDPSVDLVTLQQPGAITQGTEAGAAAHNELGRFPEAKDDLADPLAH